MRYLMTYYTCTANKQHFISAHHSDGFNSKCKLLQSFAANLGGCAASLKVLLKYKLFPPESYDLTTSPLPLMTSFHTFWRLLAL